MSQDHLLLPENLPQFDELVEEVAIECSSVIDLKEEQEKKEDEMKKQKEHDKNDEDNAEEEEKEEKKAADNIEEKADEPMFVTDDGS